MLFYLTLPYLTLPYLRGGRHPPAPSSAQTKYDALFSRHQFRCILSHSKAIVDSRLRSRCRILKNTTEQTLWLSGTATWRILLNITSYLILPIGPEVWKHDVIRKTGSTLRIATSSAEDRVKPQATCTKHFVKFGRSVFELCERTDRQTNKQTVTLIIILCTPPLGEVIMWQ